MIVDANNQVDRLRRPGVDPYCVRGDPDIGCWPGVVAWGSVAMSASGSGASRSHRIALYASVGPELTQYDVDVNNAALIKQRAVTLPANVHYAWPHASGEYLYVAS